MKLDVSNLKVFKHHDMFALKIMMPDGSDNFIHTEGYDLESILLNRSMLLEREILEPEVVIREDGTYFRLYLNLKVDNDIIHSFHSRKVNLNDAVFERDQLIS